MRSLTEQEKILFLNIGLPGITASEETKGRILYAMRKKEVIPENDLAAAFGMEYLEMIQLVQKKGMLFDNNNYVFEHYFTNHNKNKPCKVSLGQFTGFRAERKGDKNLIIAKVKLYDGTIREGLELTPTMKFSDLNLNDYVLVHKNMICSKITDKESDFIKEKYLGAKQ